MNILFIDSPFRSKLILKITKYLSFILYSLSLTTSILKNIRINKKNVIINKTKCCA